MNSLAFAMAISKYEDPERFGSITQRIARFARPALPPGPRKRRQDAISRLDLLCIGNFDAKSVPVNRQLTPGLIVTLLQP
jgi:hypothetical protein